MITYKQLNEEEKEEYDALRGCIVSDTVIDKAQYYLYLELKYLLSKDQDRYIQTSDPNLILDCASPKSVTGSMMGHLPLDEQRRISNNRAIYIKIISKISVAKRKAIGTKPNLRVNPLEAEREKILELFGQYYTVPEIIGIIKNEWGYPEVNHGILKSMYQKNLGIIEELREAFRASYDDVRLSNKKSRLIELEGLYGIRRSKYNHSKTIADEQQLLKILEQIKKEVDGDLVINGKHVIEVEQTINIQIQQEMMKEFNITALIISRLAGKLEVNPILIMSRLAKSKYSKFTGFQKPEVSKYEDEIEYYSDTVYDISKIQKVNQNLVERESKLAGYVEIEEAVVEGYISLKDRMMKQILNKKKEIENNDKL